MASNYFLACYIVKIIGTTGKIARWKALKHQNLEHTFREFTDMMNKVCANEEKFIHIPAREVNIRKEGDDKIQTGLIYSGDHDYGAVIRNGNGDLTYAKPKGEAEMKPYYFLFSPERDDEGILILQRVGKSGVKEVISSLYNDFLKERHGYGVEINQVIPTNLLVQYLKKGRIKKVKFIRRRFHEDIIEGLREAYGVETGEIELIVSAKRNGTILDDIVSRFRGGIIGLDGLVEIKPPVDFRHDMVAFEIQGADKTKKTIEIENNEITNFNFTFNVTGQVQLDAEGNPVFETIDEVARSILQQVQEAVEPQKQ